MSEASEMDFSRASSLVTIDYPSAFTKCFNSSCQHRVRNFLKPAKIHLPISIIIPTRDVPNNWIEKLVIQVVAQSAPADEIILIDDNDEQRNFENITNLNLNLRIITASP